MNELAKQFVARNFFPPSLNASKSPVASAGDAKRKQSAARGSALGVLNKSSLSLPYPAGNVGHADMHVLREGAALAGGRATTSLFGG